MWSLWTASAPCAVLLVLLSLLAPSLVASASVHARLLLPLAALFSVLCLVLAAPRSSRRPAPPPRSPALRALALLALPALASAQGSAAALLSSALGGVRASPVGSLLSALLCSLVAWLLSISLATRKRGLNPLHPPVAAPLTRLGSSRFLTFLEFSASPLRMIHRLHDLHGPAFTLSMFSTNITVLVGPEAQAPFFTSPDAVLSQAEVYGFMKPVFGEGVVYDCPARKRQVQFQSMSHGLRPARLKTYVSKISAETTAYLRSKLGPSGECDLGAVLGELTILTASRCLHGDDVRENMYAQVADLYHDLDQGVT
ncbi:hypothetical protein TeGR_g14197, partial [Tetraparma gracilis]